MKKLLILSALFITCSFNNPNNYATTWAATASNQCITGLAMANAITTSVFPSKCATSVFTDLGLRLITKNELYCLPSVNIQATALAAKTNNQPVIKSDFVEYSNSLSVYSRNNGTYTTACVTALLPETGGLFYTIYYNGTFGIGTIFRINASLSGRDAGVKITFTSSAFEYTLINSTYNLYQVSTTCVSSKLLLDGLNSSAAYSLRKLRTAYSGPVIRVRRSSDNAEADIGFTASGDLDTVTLLAFVGTGNGFVTTWYDQSGNGRNATQLDPTRQPQIVASGAVLTMNSRPALRFNGTSTFLNAPTVVMTGQNWTFNCTATMASATQNNARLVSAVRSVASGGNGTDWNDPASWVILSRVGATSAIHSENVTGVMNIAFDTPYVISITRNSGASIGVINGVTRVTSSGTLSNLNTTSGLRIGRSINPGFEANENWAGLGSEIILLQNLSTTDRQAIESNQMQYYGITSSTVVK
jgi:hypothetical protein